MGASAVLLAATIFKEKLSEIQIVAVLLATIGVSHEIFRFGLSGSVLQTLLPQMQAVLLPPLLLRYRIVPGIPDSLQFSQRQAIRRFFAAGP